MGIYLHLTGSGLHSFDQQAPCLTFLPNRRGQNDLHIWMCQDGLQEFPNGIVFYVQAKVLDTECSVGIDFHL
jgi:hypothetical protein